MGKKMRRVVLAGILFSVTALAAVAGDTVVEEIIARVNSQIVTNTEFQRTKEQTANEIRQQYNGPDLNQKIADAEKNVLRDLIDQQLLVQKAADLGITGDTELVKRLDEIRKQMNLPDMEALEKEAQKQGISFEEFKQNTRNSIITQEVIRREVGSNIKMTNEEVKKFYDEHKAEMEQPEQVRLSEILVSTEIKDGKTGESTQASPEQIAAAEKKAQDIYAQLKAGAKFDDLAKKMSDGPTAADGGDLQYFKRGTLAKELEDKVFAMNAGDVSEPIHTKQGFVILKVTEHTQAGVPPLKQVEPRIQEAIYMQKLQPQLREYLTKLREDAFIDIKPGYVDSGASPKQTKPVFTTAAEDAKAKDLKHKRKKKLGIF
jgi:peptidyl-prolyl cis-trans isomerase SurA